MPKIEGLLSMNRQQEIKLQEEWMAKNKVTIIPEIKDKQIYYPMGTKERFKTRRKGAMD